MCEGDLRKRDKEKERRVQLSEKTHESSTQPEHEVEFSAYLNQLETTSACGDFVVSIQTVLLTFVWTPAVSNTTEPENQKEHEHNDRDVEDRRQTTYHRVHNSFQTGRPRYKPQGPKGPQSSKNS